MAENISFNTESLGAPVDTLSYEQARAEQREDAEDGEETHG